MDITCRQRIESYPIPSSHLLPPKVRLAASPTAEAEEDGAASCIEGVSHELVAGLETTRAVSKFKESVDSIPDSKTDSILIPY